MIKQAFCDKIEQYMNIIEMYLIPNLSGDLQMPLAAYHGFVKLAHYFQRVAQVPAGLGLAQLVAHVPGEGQVQLVILHRFNIVTQVEVRVAQLAVDRAQYPQIVRAGLDRRLEERHSGLAVARLAEAFALQCQFQAHVPSLAVLLNVKNVHVKKLLKEIFC